MDRFDQAANLQGLGRNQNLQLRAIQQTEAQRKLQNELNKLQKRDRGGKEALLILDGVQKAKQVAEQALALEPCIVREYAYRRGTDANGASEVRSDFAETLYWHPALVLANGQADISFDLCDSVTTFQVIVAGHTGDGRLGAATADLECRKPFSLSATVPLEVTANDTIDLPVAVANGSDEARRVHVSLALQNLSLTAGTSTATRQEVQLAPQKRERMIFRLRPTVREGIATITLRGTSEPFGADTVQYSFRIVPEGFPAAEMRSDMLEGIAQQEITLPRDWVKKTLKCELQCLSVVAGGPPARIGRPAAGAARLLRADFDQQLSQRNDPELPARERPGASPAAGRLPGTRPFDARLPEADRLRVP